MVTKLHPIQERFIKLRRRILMEAWEEEKARLIAEGVPAASLEIPRPRKTTEEPRR